MLRSRTLHRDGLVGLARDDHPQDRPHRDPAEEIATSCCINFEESMYDHITIRVKNFDRSRAFYESALAPLGCKLMDSASTSAGFGTAGRTQLWIEEGTPVSAGLHVAFASPSHKRPRTRRGLRA